MRCMHALYFLVRTFLGTFAPGAAAWRCGSIRPGAGSQLVLVDVRLCVRCLCCVCFVAGILAADAASHPMSLGHSMWPALCHTVLGDVSLRCFEQRSPTQSARCCTHSGAATQADREITQITAAVGGKEAGKGKHLGAGAFWGTSSASKMCRPKRNASQSTG